MHALQLNSYVGTMGEYNYGSVPPTACTCTDFLLEILKGFKKY